jgi:aspartyl aminopeptidase
MESEKNECNCCSGKKEEEKKIVPSLANLTEEEKKDLEEYVVQYKDFLDNARTPRQVVDYVEELALKNGLSEDQIFINSNRSNIAIVNYSKASIDKGVKILGAHVDSPCLHIKVKPIKEDNLGVRLDTQYYGGIVKYQWFDQQVNVIGHVVKEGKEIPINLKGVIIDEAPHINRDIANKLVKDAFDAEDLDVITGYSRKEDLLKDLGIEEKDFQRAELYVVPVEKTMILKDLIVGYGHDDRVCVFTEMMALLKSNPTNTSIVFGVDKEEIGSTGITGAQAVFFEQVFDQIVSKKKSRMLDKITQPYERTILAKSVMLSADVDIATTYRSAGLVDVVNDTKTGYGIAISAYCGHGGKFEGNQVTAQLMDKLMNMFDKNGAIYQVSGLPSRVDKGGGGTIAKYFSQKGIQTVDAGVPVAGMHSKTETIHKGDLYQAIKCFKVFLEN